jgi:hypothetical protein
MIITYREKVPELLEVELISVNFIDGFREMYPSQGYEMIQGKFILKPKLFSKMIITGFRLTNTRKAHYMWQKHPVLY